MQNSPVMAYAFDKHLFCIVGDSRLRFEDAHARIDSYIAARLAHHRAPYEFCADWTLMESRLRQLLKSPPSDVEHIVIVDAMNPFLDMALVERMTKILLRTKAAYSLCDGAIPGTEVRAVLRLSEWQNRSETFTLNSLVDGNGALVRWETQAQYNNQLNLYKYKRVKLFLALVDAFKELPHLSIPELMSLLGSAEAFALLTRFGTDVRLMNYSRCPHCDGNLDPRANTMSQPLCGYLPNTHSLYHECESCGLVVQSPSVHQDDVHKIYDKWDKQDFVKSTNNPYTSDSIRCDFTKLAAILPENARTLDLGGGIGNFSKFLHEKYPHWNVTHSDFEIKSKAPNGVRARTLDFTRNPIGSEQYDLITAWEVIEHVPYHRLVFMLKNICEALTPGGFFVFSTPDFDSPLCKSFDFYALCPPFHYLVFGERWLKRYFADSEAFEVFDIRHCSDFLDDAVNWYKYGSKTCPSMAMRGTAELLRAVFELDIDKSIRNRLAASGLGTEIIMTLRKKASPKG